MCSYQILEHPIKIEWCLQEDFRSVVDLHTGFLHSDHTRAYYSREVFLYRKFIGYIISCSSNVYQPV